MKDLYRTKNTRLEQTKNQGFDYRGKILSKVLSSHLFENPTNAEFLSYLEQSVTQNVEDIKMIKKIFCFSIHKKSNNIV